MEPTEKVPIKGLGQNNWRVWLTERSRELIPETRGKVAYMEETTVIRREDDIDGRARKFADAD